MCINKLMQEQSDAFEFNKYYDDDGDAVTCEIQCVTNAEWALVNEIIALLEPFKV